MDSTVEVTVRIPTPLRTLTGGADATMQQVTTFDGAMDGWIDVWGLLFGVPRNDNEGNAPYAVRVAETVLAWVGTGPAIAAWIVTWLNPPTTLGAGKLVELLVTGTSA